MQSHDRRKTRRAWIPARRNHPAGVAYPFRARDRYRLRAPRHSRRAIRRTMLPRPPKVCCVGCCASRLTKYAGNIARPARSFHQPPPRLAVSDPGPNLRVQAESIALAPNPQGVTDELATVRCFGGPMMAEVIGMHLALHLSSHRGRSRQRHQRRLSRARSGARCAKRFGEMSLAYSRKGFAATSARDCVPRLKNPAFAKVFAVWCAR